MSNIGDGLCIGLVETPPDKCPICEKAPHPARTTKDKKEGKGCLDSIPDNLGCSPLEPNPTIPPFATAAHHLIPANQCLKPFKRLSQMCHAVGYDVNNKQNGLALPTCGQQEMNRYQTSSGGITNYDNLSTEDKREVSFVIMEALQRQWHVGHHKWVLDLKTDGESHPENYDKLVKLELRKLEKSFKDEGKEICEPEDEKEESGSSVIADMNELSQRIMSYVLNWNQFYVSAKACEFAMKYKGG